LRFRLTRTAKATLMQGAAGFEQFPIQIVRILLFAAD
jgi:hypothetical protein